MKSAKILFLLVVFLTAVSCGQKRDRGADILPTEVKQKSDLTEAAEKWADSVCNRLTLRQKVAQMFIPSLYASDDYWTVRKIEEYADSCIGGILFLKGDSQSASEVGDKFRDRSGVGPFIAIDAEWGLSMRLADAPKFPDNSHISPKADDQLMYDYGREVARECRQIGINMVLGPVVDVSVPNSFMKKRSFGENPVVVADMALAYARGLEDGGVISVAKHFPGHGSVSTDSHLKKAVILRTISELDSIDLYPFRKWIEQRLSAIMVGHLAVPAIDKKMRPAAMSHAIISGLLRDSLGFKGLVLTDALSMKGAEGLGADDAIIAGADMVIAPVDMYKEISNVLKAIEEGNITEAEIDGHIKKILFYKYLLGIGNKLHRNNSVKNREALNTPETDSIVSRLRGY